MKRSPAIQLWSAAPTPLTADLQVDIPSLERMVQDAGESGLDGLFLAGTCGEGPWLPNRERQRLVATAKAAAGSRLKIAVQVSDNSAPRIGDNMEEAAAAGADYVIIAPPAMMMNVTPSRIVAHYQDAIARSPLPVGLYDLGARRNYAIPEDRLQEVYLLPQVSLIKDSSADPARRDLALAARRAKPELRLFNGDEFRCVEYLEAGYDGCMFGGASAVTRELRELVALFQEGRREEAFAADAQLQARLYDIYGGKSIACWLTGLKYAMLRKGIFASTASYFGYPLTDECRRVIERYFP